MESGSSPLAAGPTGASFEVQVGASFLLEMLAESPCRGMKAFKINQVSFQQGDAGHPLDDVIVEGTNKVGEIVTLEIQAKHSISFSPQDENFKKVMKQVSAATKMEGFWNEKSEFAVATAQTSRQISSSYQQVLQWARELNSGLV